MKTFSLSIALISALMVPAFANADVEIHKVDVDTVKISYTASDLLNEIGRAELERKIRHAAESVCGPQKLRAAGSHRQKSINRNCYEQAVEKALNSIPAIG